MLAYTLQWLRLYSRERERKREVGRSIFTACVCVCMLYVGVTLHKIYFWVLFSSLVCLCVSVSVGTENYPQTLCTYQDTSWELTPLLCLALFVSVWYSSVNFDPNLSFFSSFFFKIKLNPIHVIKKMLGIPSLFSICFLKRWTGGPIDRYVFKALYFQ